MIFSFEFPCTFSFFPRGPGIFIHLVVEILTCTLAHFHSGAGWLVGSLAVHKICKQFPIKNQFYASTATKCKIVADIRKSRSRRRRRLSCRFIKWANIKPKFSDQTSLSPRSKAVGATCKLQPQKQRKFIGKIKKNT